MTQSTRILEELKLVLKQRDIGYREVAEHLGLSQSSVKRLFSQGGFTLERLDAVCELAQVDLADLASRAERGSRQLAALTQAQELQVVEDPALLMVAICALNRWGFEDIRFRYAFSEPELISLLVRLDRLGLLELLPGNRIKLRIARTFAWLPNGPIQQFFVNHVQEEFLAGDFSEPASSYRFTWGMLSAESALALQSKIGELVETFDSRASADEARRSAGASGTCLLVAFREWEPASFTQMRR